MLIFAGFVNRYQRDAIESLPEKYTALREQLGRKRLRLTGQQRRRLAVKAKAVGRKRLFEIGVINAFLMPARDSLLSRVAGTMMIQTITLMTVVQFSAQFIGTLVGGVMEWVGTPTILGLRALVLLFGVWFASQLPGVEVEVDDAVDGVRDSTDADFGFGIKGPYRERDFGRRREVNVGG
jgi:hypothetical protein